MNSNFSNFQPTIELDDQNILELIGDIDSNFDYSSLHLEEIENSLQQNIATEDIFIRKESETVVWNEQQIEQIEQPQLLKPAGQIESDFLLAFDFIDEAEDREEQTEQTLNKSDIQTGRIIKKKTKKQVFTPSDQLKSRVIIREATAFINEHYTSKLQRLFTCHACNTNNILEKGQYRHYYNHHANKAFKCVGCKTLYSTIKGLKAHCQKCESIGKKFYTVK